MQCIGIIRYIAIMTADRSMTHLMRWSPCWLRGVWAPLQGWTPCAPTQEPVLLLLLQSWIAPSPHLHANRHSHTTLRHCCALLEQHAVYWFCPLVYWPMDCTQPSHLVYWACLLVYGLQATFTCMQGEQRLQGCSQLTSLIMHMSLTHTHTHTHIYIHTSQIWRESRPSRTKLKICV